MGPMCASRACQSARSRVEGGSRRRAEATLELDARYAPIPADTQAILRQKTLLGETYVELTPARRVRGACPRAATCPRPGLEAVSSTRSSAPSTGNAGGLPGLDAGPGRRARGRGEDFSVAIASLEPFADEAERAAPARYPERGGPRVRARAARSSARCPSARASSGADRERERRVRDDGAAQRGPRRGVHDLPDVPARVAGDAYAPRRSSRSTPIRSSPRCARRRASSAPTREALADLSPELEVVLPRLRHDRRRAEPACGRPAACWTTTCRRCSGASTDWLAPVNAIFEVAAATAAR